jgi:hypothetical protein
METASPFEETLVGPIITSLPGSRSGGEALAQSLGAIWQGSTGISDQNWRCLFDYSVRF